VKTSADWLRHFHANTNHFLDMPWDAGAELTPQEHEAIAHSVQEFQRGESSEGRHFLGYAEAYAAATGDRDYVAALRLFIAEEQRHARVLARFLAINGIPLVRATFSDRVFRLLRHLLGTLEISVAVLITAEIIAQVYYAALRTATGSLLLRRLCDQILRDEASHVEFQAEQLAKLRARRGRLFYGVTLAAQRALFFGTCLVVWVVHGSVFRAGGQTFREFWRGAWEHFDSAFARSTVARLRQFYRIPVRPTKPKESPVAASLQGLRSR